MGPFGVDFPRRNETEHQKSRTEQGGGDEEDRANREKVSARTHCGGRKSVADRSETSITSKPVADGLMADQAKADRRYRRPQDAACQSMQDGRRQHHDETGGYGVGKGADRDGRNAEASDETLRASGVHERTAWHLPGERHDAADREDQTNIYLRPFLFGQVHRNKWTKAGLDVGDEKDKPVQPPCAAPRRTGRWFVAHRPHHDLVQSVRFIQPPLPTLPRERRG